MNFSQIPKYNQIVASRQVLLPFIIPFLLIVLVVQADAQRWDFTSSVESWAARNSNTRVRWSGDGNGRLYMDTYGNDPGMVRSGLSLSASTNNLIEMYVWTYCSDRDAEIFFKRSGSSTMYSGGRIYLTDGSSGGTYDFDMSGVSNWSGTITEIRIDPSDSCGSSTSPGFIAFDWIETKQRPNNPPVVTFAVDQAEISHGWNNGITVSSHDPDGDEYSCRYRVGKYGTEYSANLNGWTSVPADRFSLGSNDIYVKCTDIFDAYGEPSPQTVIDYSVPSSSPGALSPSDGDVLLISNSYRFDFSGVSGGIPEPYHYQVMIADNPQYNNPVEEREVAGSPFYESDSVLQPGKAYYWKICAENKLGSQGPCSEASFSIQSPNNPPVITGFSLSHAEITNGWELIGTVSSFEPDGDPWSCAYQVNGGAWQETGVNNGSFPITGLTTGNNVSGASNSIGLKCTDSHDKYGTWSSPPTVTVYALTNTPPVIVSPIGEIDEQQSYEFKFDAAKDAFGVNAHHYQVTIADDDAFSNHVYSEEQAGSPFYIGNEVLQAGTTYFWKICGENKLGSQGPCAEASFIVPITIPPDIRIEPTTLEINQSDTPIVGPLLNAAVDNGSRAKKYSSGDVAEMTGLAHARVYVSKLADLKVLQRSIEALGGSIHGYTAERAFFIGIAAKNLAKLKLIKGVVRIKIIHKLADKDRSGEGGFPVPGTRQPTPVEQKYIDQKYTKTEKIYPSALSIERALLEGLDVTPTSADNSISQYFPPIDHQGAQASCTAWAACYYYSTYTQAQDENLVVDDGNQEYIASPAFMFPLVNRGFDSGVATQNVVARLNDVGCSSWALKPYDETDYTSWPSETAWIDALNRRTEVSHDIDLTTQEGIDALKQHLANGNIAVTESYMYANWASGFNDNEGRGINNGVLFSHEGETNMGGHAMTIVGYDDNRSYNDGTSTKYGAFLVANSWGNSWGTFNSTGSAKGYMWIAYDYAMTNNSCFDKAYYNDDRDDYRPRLYATAGLSNAERGYISYKGGIGPITASDWDSYYPIQRDGGINLPAYYTEAIAVDLTDGIPYISDYNNIELFVEMELGFGSSSNGEIRSADFYHDFDGDGIYKQVTSTDPVVTVPPGDTGFAGVSFSRFNDYKTFTIYNDGGEALIVDDIATCASWMIVGGYLSEIGPGDSQDVTVAVDWDIVPGSGDSCVIQVYSSDPDENPYPGGVTVNAMCSNTYYRDSDGDNFGDPNNSTIACTQPSGYVLDNSDCNDNDGNINLLALEVCDYVDNNCNYETDENFLDLGDVCTAGVGVCEASGSMVCRADGTGTECDAVPTDPTEDPEGTCDDSLDNDCDTLTDSPDPDCYPQDYYCDGDNDGHSDHLSDGTCIGNECQSVNCQLVPGDDCDDNNENLWDCNTPVNGDAVTITDGDGNAVTFPVITAGGDTSITTDICQPGQVEGIALTDTTVCADITTSAAFDGMAEVCLVYDDTDMSQLDEESLRMIRCDEQGSCDLLAESKPNDTSNNVVCGLTDHLSTYTVGIPLDSDSDTIFDLEDNCSQTPNSGQQNTDNDKYGNICDCDLDNNGVVAIRDFRMFRAAWQSTPSAGNWNPDADFNSDGIVGMNDFNIFKVRWQTTEPWE